MPKVGYYSTKIGILEDLTNIAFVIIFADIKTDHMHPKRLIIAVSAALLAVSCGNHFITDGGYRKTVHADYEARQALFAAPLADLGSLEVTMPEREALEFLYAYMPLADVADYTPSFYLENVRASFRAREEMPWGKDVPELLFRHFVLPLRANNENLDGCRSVFYEELGPRVEGLSAREAILEVNHWCHEKVTYQPSDGRTLSPLAAVKTAFGRCGEESTFTVAALRAVGIPARQVYTPRWAHTDDNHAWVEAWADGKWWFIGACEPEPVLNLGWFNAPASRAMLMHTKVFGKYDGPEEVVLRSPNYTEINLIDNYARTARADLRVLSADGTPVDSARVDFGIYNYAEFYPAVAKYTDAAGKTFLTAGLGDMLAWASKGGRYGFAKVSFGTDSLVTVVLDHPAAEDVEVCRLDIVPPPENVQLPEVTPQMRAENDLRFAREDSLRHAYTATFLNRETAAEWVKEKGLPGRAAAFLARSSGNAATLQAFLEEADDKERALDLLGTLSWKDLHDVAPEELADSYNARESVLAPRVELEFLSPYKHFLRENVPADLAASFRPSGDSETAADAAAAAIVAWINANVTVDSEPLSWRIPMSPEGVWKGRVTDPRSRAIFFVALARTFGLDARKDPVTGKLQYRAAEGPWKDVDFEAESQGAAPTGTLILTHHAQADGIDNPSYYSHFSISRIREDGRTSLLSFDEGQVDMGGGVSFASFRNGVDLDEGTYLLVSGNRLADGSVPVTARLFTIRAGEKTIVPLEIRTVDDAVSVIGSFDAETPFLPDGETAPRSILSETGRGCYVAAVLGVGGEPTNHVLRDISAEKEALEAWGRPILLLTTSEEQMARLKTELAAGNFGTLPSTVRFGIDRNGNVLSRVTSNLDLRAGSLPVVFIADTFNRVLFVSQGYTIGLGARLSAIADQL